MLNESSQTVLEPLSIEGQASGLANDITALCEGLSATMKRYLAHLVVASSITEAAGAAGVKASTVRAWRCQTPGFRQAETLAKESGGSLSRRIAIELANAHTGHAVSRVITEMGGAEHARDRLKAAETLLKVGGLLGANGGGRPTIDASTHQTLVQGATMEQIREWFRGPSVDS